MKAEGLEIPAEKGAIFGDLEIPRGASAVVVFAHGSGSSRSSPRNRLVAARLRAEGLGTFLIDLLTEDEARVDERTAALRFDIPLLARRLLLASDFLKDRPEASALRLGYFGASTGAAAALRAAAERPKEVLAVVSRGGRPDLADDALERVRAPTLLIVGGADEDVLALNREAAKRLSCEKRVEVLPGATHLFEEPGALERVAELAAGWLADHL